MAGGRLLMVSRSTPLTMKPVRSVTSWAGTTFIVGMKPLLRGHRDVTCLMSLKKERCG